MSSFDHLEKPLPCVDCGSSASIEVGAERIYPHRWDLREKRYWLCPCGAFVGCHPGSNKPLGAPALSETRKVRSAAHAFFDPLWERKMRHGYKKREARRAGYIWLSVQMSLDPRDCHISYFSREQALRVVEICKPFYRKQGTA